MTNSENLKMSAIMDALQKLEKEKMAMRRKKAIEAKRAMKFNNSGKFI